MEQYLINKDKNIDYAFIQIILKKKTNFLNTLNFTNVKIFVILLDE